MVLKSVANDSCCPDGTNSIWAGDVTIVIDVIENLKIVETKSMVVSSKSQKENIVWFSKYYATQKIKSFQVLPYPKCEVSIDPKSYSVKINFE